jgi:hypothetical protein
MAPDALAAPELEREVLPAIGIARREALLRTRRAGRPRPFKKAPTRHPVEADENVRAKSPKSTVIAGGCVRLLPKKIVTLKWVTRWALFKTPPPPRGPGDETARPPPLPGQWSDWELTDSG